MPERMKPMHVQIVLFDGFDPLDVIAPYEVLTAGAMAAPDTLSIELVSAEGPNDVVSGTNGLILRAVAQLDPEKADLIIVPGASGRVTVPEADVETLTIPRLLAKTLETNLPILMKQALDNPEVLVATVCGGSLLLAMAGLLEGRHVVTHYMGMDLLSATGAIPVKARVVDDGDLITAGGVTSGLDLSLYLLERLLGSRIAHSVEDLFEYERRGTPWKLEGMEAIAI